MDLFTYLLKKKGHNSSINGDLFSYLLASRKRGTYQTYTGTQINVNDSINARMKNWILGGNSNQNGTPTPDAPIDIHNVIGENNVIENSGKNLYEPILNNVNLNGLTPKIENDGSISASGTITSTFSNICTDTEIYLQPGTYTYSLSKTYTHRCNIRVYTNKEYTEWETLEIGVGQTKVTKTFTKKIYGWRFYITGVTANTEVKENYKVQVEVGSTATPFEKYKGKNYKVSLGNIELCKIGDYQDKIYKSNDKWLLEKNIGKLVINENTPIESSGVSTGFDTMRVLMTNVLNPRGIVSSANVLCNRFVGNVMWNRDEEGIYIDQNNAVYRINTEIIGGTTREALLNWLVTNNIILYYPLSITNVTEITDDNLIEQLEQLSKARSFDEQTNITQLSEQLPFDLTVDIKSL